MASSKDLDSASRYGLFGLTIESDVPLPELPSIGPTDALTDVEIRVEPIAADRTEPGLHRVGHRQVLLCVPDIGRYEVADGKIIRVEAEAAAHPKNVRLYLLGSAFGLLLHQRGLLALHANAVEIDGRAILFTGASGEGKSTLAAWFHDQGYRVLADDVCVIRFTEEGIPMADPGIPRLRLWTEALEATGREPSRYPRSWAGDDDWDKYDVELAMGTEVQSALPVGAIYLLGRAGCCHIEPLNGVAAARAVIENSYRGAHIATAGDPRSHWASCVKLVSHVPVFRFGRSGELGRLGEEARQVVAHARTLDVMSRGF